ncbi:hypothetical protein ACFWWM_42300 [Streptomyces sp. NPDC058682]
MPSSRRCDRFADDVEECGLDAADLRRTADIAQAGAHRLVKTWLAPVAGR